MRLKEFQEYLENNSIDFSLLQNSFERKNPNFAYFTQTDKIDAVLVLNKNPVLHVSSLEYSIAKKYSKIKDIEILNKKFLENIKKLNPKIIGIDKDYITLSQFNNLKSKLKKIKFKDISKKIKSLRLTKTEEEINFIKKSCNFADLILEKALKFIEKNKTEIEVKKLIEKEIVDLNLELSFQPIIASNINSKNPHHLSGNTKLKGFTIIDLGVKYKNYCSDISRTIFIGKPNKIEKEIYNKVLEAQEKAILENLSPKNLHKKAQNILGKYFTHSLGHGIGLEVHELPKISLLSKDKFKENMVFTIEPGYYNKFGIRIEDDFLYKNSKKILLTKSPKSLLTL